MLLVSNANTTHLTSWYHCKPTEVNLWSAKPNIFLYGEPQQISMIANSATRVRFQRSHLKVIVCQNDLE